VCGSNVRIDEARVWDIDGRGVIMCGSSVGIDEARVWDIDGKV
jgi:hypothetical protein